MIRLVHCASFVWCSSAWRRYTWRQWCALTMGTEITVVGAAGTNEPHHNQKKIEKVDEKMEKSHTNERTIETYRIFYGTSISELVYLNGLQHSQTPTFAPLHIHSRAHTRRSTIFRISVSGICMALLTVRCTGAFRGARKRPSRMRKSYYKRSN